MRQVVLLTFLLGMCLVAHPGVARVVFDDRVHGPASSNSAAPTILPVGLGSNEVRGSSRAVPLTPVFFSFTLDPGWTLDRLTLLDYAFLGVHDMGGSFLAIQKGPEVTGLDYERVHELLGAGLIGRTESTAVGSNLLIELGISSFGEIGFAGPLPEGTYSIWYQENSGDTLYAFDLVVTPLPAALPLFAAGLAIAAALRAARDRHGRQRTGPQ